MNTLRPTFQWNQTDPDSGTTFTYFQMQITNEANNVMVQDTGQFYQGTTSNLGSWMINQDLPAGQKLRVRVRVFDGVTWSDYSAQTWFYINRAPVAEFDWSPKPVWEGDVVQITNTSFDSDGDALTYQWKLEQPDGATITSSSKDISHRFLKPGVYKVTLAVSDGLLSSTVVKMIAAMPLTIHSDVTYTNNWLLLHEKSGHQTVTVPKEFYSGEIFIVSSKSSPAPVDEVTAWMDTTGIDGHSIYVSQRLVAGAGDATSFSGEIFDAKFQSFAEGLPQGLQTIHFQIRYRNGVVKTEDIPVQIIGNVNKSAGVHRVQ
jgi:PKD repeat protein